MKRVLTAVALVPPVVYVVLWAPYWVLFAVVAIVAFLSYREYSDIAAKLVPGSASPLGYAAGLLVLAWPGETWLVFTLLALLAMTLAMRAPDLADALPRAAFLVTGVIYAFGCWKCALLLHAANPHWLMFSLLVNWAGDIGAYYVGKSLGKHRLAPRVSPAKSWEGSAGAVVAAVAIGGFYLLHFIPSIPVAQAIGLTIATNVAGQIGDLAESALKRGAGVKDSGTILPGHGGFLDRVDSTLFALPLVYAYLRLV
jgi:phosphatidate cytidylyltransferase